MSMVLTDRQKDNLFLWSTQACGATGPGLSCQTCWADSQILPSSGANGIKLFYLSLMLLGDKLNNY